MRKPLPPDPHTGRAAVVLAGLLGGSAMVAYAANTPRPAASIEAHAPAVRVSAGLGELVARAQTARESLDLDALERAAEELEQFAEQTTLATKANTARLELVEIHAALALEAAVRARFDDEGRDAALHRVGREVTRTRALADGLSDASIDRARLDAALARAELASGADLTQSHPVVLMPTFRDPELRAAAIAVPLWRDLDEPVAAELAHEITNQLRTCERQTTLVRLLTARAIAHEGDTAAARDIVDGVLREIPRQPLAKAMQRRLLRNDAAVVAMAEADGGPTTAPTPTPPTPSEAPPRVPVEPTPDEPAPVAVSNPTPSKPAPATPSKPTAAKPDATKKKTYDTLLDEGCKLVRSGNADAGFEKLKQAFDLNPNAVAVTVCMAEAHHALGRDASARALCERALRKSPGDRRARLLAAELELARGNESAALEHYRRILQNHPDDAKAKAFVESHGG